MKSISLKIDDDIFGETEKIRTRIRKPRNRYINEAIELYNQIQRRHLLKDKLAKESRQVRKYSMLVLRDFEDMDHEED